VTALTTQSTTPSTVPSGTAIAADQVGTANPPGTADRIQYVKLDCGGDGASSPVKAGNGLPVSPVDATVSGNITATDANNGAAVLGSSALYNAAPTAGSFIALNVSGMSSAEVHGIGAGWTGTCYIEGSLDSTTGSDGSWTGILFANRANPPQQQHYVNFPGARYHGPVGALKWLRLRCQGGITAGPIPVVLRASLAPAGLEMVSPLPNGGNTIGSVSITNAPAALKNGAFAIPVWPNALQLLTYTFPIRNLVTGALTANTVKALVSLEVAAVGTKTVKIRRLIVSGYQTTALAGTFDIQLQRGSAASSAGTAVTAGVRVTGDAAPGTVVKTLPTIVAATVLDVLPCAATPTTAATGFGATVLYDWQESGETKPWTLKPGVIDSLVLNGISTAAQNWTLTVHITLTEE
jgi:hypothetical protein